jgi:hypothetical protein
MAQASNRWRKAGVILHISTLTDRDENINASLELIMNEIKDQGYKVKILMQGDRPAFSWEVEERDLPQ